MPEQAKTMQWTLVMGRQKVSTRIWWLQCRGCWSEQEVSQPVYLHAFTCPFIDGMKRLPREVLLAHELGPAADHELWTVAAQAQDAAAANAQQVAAVQEQKTIAAQDKVVAASKKEQGFGAQQEEWLMAATVQGYCEPPHHTQIAGDSCSFARSGNANCWNYCYGKDRLCSGGHPPHPPETRIAGGWIRLEVSQAISWSWPQASRPIARWLRDRVLRGGLSSAHTHILSG